MGLITISNTISNTAVPVVLREFMRLSFGSVPNTLPIFLRQDMSLLRFQQTLLAFVQICVIESEGVAGRKECLLLVDCQTKILGLAVWALAPVFAA